MLLCGHSTQCLAGAGGEDTLVEALLPHARNVPAHDQRTYKVFSLLQTAGHKYLSCLQKTTDALSWPHLLGTRYNLIAVYLETLRIQGAAGMQLTGIYGHLRPIGLQAFLSMIDGSGLTKHVLGTRLY